MTRSATRWWLLALLWCRLIIDWRPKPNWQRSSFSPPFPFRGMSVRLTSNDAGTRTRGLELAVRMVHAAHDLGIENLLVVPGAVHIPWLKDHEPVPNDACHRRAREAVGRLVPLAEKLGVFLNIENIFFNGYLLSPEEAAGYGT
jgi:sugar phosphate isomerase/epimerase